MLRRLKAPTVGKIGLNRSFISINSLIPCVFALPESEIIFRAKDLSLFYPVSLLISRTLSAFRVWFLRLAFVLVIAETAYYVRLFALDFILATILTRPLERVGERCCLSPMRSMKYRSA